MVKKILSLGVLATLVLFLGAIVLSVLSLVGCHSHGVANLNLWEIQDPNQVLDGQNNRFKVGQSGVCAYDSSNFDQCQAGHTPYYFEIPQIDTTNTYPESSSMGHWSHRLRTLMRAVWIVLIVCVCVDFFCVLCLLAAAFLPVIAIPTYLVLGCTQLLCLAAAILQTYIAYRARHHINKDNIDGVHAKLGHGGLAMIWSSFALRLLVVGLFLGMFGVYLAHHRKERKLARDKDEEDSYTDAYAGNYANEPLTREQYSPQQPNLAGYANDSINEPGHAGRGAPVAGTAAGAGTGMGASHHTTLEKNGIDPNCPKCQAQHDLDPNCPQCKQQMANDHSTLGSSPLSSPNSYYSNVERKLEM